MEQRVEHRKREAYVHRHLKKLPLYTPRPIRIHEAPTLSVPKEITTRTANLTTSKILWNSVLSTENRKYMCIDIKKLPLYTPRPIQIHEAFALSVSKHIKQQNDLEVKAKKDYVYVEIGRSIYGLPQAGKLANTALKEHLAPYGYFEVAHTLGLWRHITCPIAFSLVIDNFGVKYVHKDDAHHLANSLKNTYKLAKDWTGSLYCGITLK